MKKVYKITRCHTDLHEDSYKDGEGEFVSNWSLVDICPKLKLSDFDSLNDLLLNVADEYLLDYKKPLKKLWYIFEDPDLKNEIRFDCDQLLDENNCVADKEDIKQWKKGKKKLNVAHTVLYVKAIYVKETKYNEMYKDAKALGLEDI